MEQSMELPRGWILLSYMIRMRNDFHLPGNISGCKPDAPIDLQIGFADQRYFSPTRLTQNAACCGIVCQDQYERMCQRLTQHGITTSDSKPGQEWGNTSWS